MQVRVQHAPVSHQRRVFWDERRSGLSKRAWLPPPGWYLQPMKHAASTFLPVALLTVYGAAIRPAT